MADNLLSLAGRTVLGIFAHPDDESLACGGTLARVADAGARVVVLCATLVLALLIWIGIKLLKLALWVLFWVVLVGGMCWAAWLLIRAF